MFIKPKENQAVLAGYVGIVEEKTPGLVVVNIAADKLRNPDKPFKSVAFTAPMEGAKGQNLAELARNHIKKGMYVTVVADVVQKGEYENLYARFVEFGPKTS